jgi:hypothetical protein
MKRIGSHEKEYLKGKNESEAKDTCLGDTYAEMGRRDGSETCEARGAGLSRGSS